MSGLFPNFRTIPSLQITNTTASTSATTGALIVAGGIGVGGNIISTGRVESRLITDSTVFFVSQANGDRNLSFGSNGLVCDTAGIFGKSNWSGTAVAEISSQSFVGLLVQQGNAGNNNDLQQWCDFNNNKLAAIDSIGNFFTQNITASRYSLPAAGINPPTFNSRSAGTKLVLYPSISSTSSDYSIGMEASAIWFSVENQFASFNYYGGNTKVASISGTGIVTANQFRLSVLNTPPASATAPGTTGEIRIDTNFIYVCTATNTWKRAGLSAW